MTAWQPGSFPLLEDGDSQLPALGSDIYLSHAVGAPRSSLGNRGLSCHPSQLSLATDFEGI